MSSTAALSNEASILLNKPVALCKIANNSAFSVPSYYAAAQSAAAVTEQTLDDGAQTSGGGTPNSSPAKVVPQCFHGNKEDYKVQDDKAYFTKKYLEKSPTWPSTCANQGCKKPTFGQDYKVSISRPVYCCANATNKNHPCVHAYCKPCYDLWQPNTGTPRKRHRRTYYQ